VATANIGCIMQLERYLPVPVIHIAELLDWASGGRRRADACYRSMADAIARRGVFVGRAPLDYHDLHMGQAMPSFLRACSGIKRALDPNSVIAPGKYGIM